MEYVLDESRNLLPLSLPLAAFAPHYRNQKLNAMMTGADGSVGQATPDAISVLAQYAPQYITEAIELDFLSYLLQAPDKAELVQRRNTAKEVFGNSLLPGDMGFLIRNRHGEKGLGPFPFELFEFLSRPMLSGFNVRLSSGPRPRIRGGNGHLPEIKAWEKMVYPTGPIRGNP